MPGTPTLKYTKWGAATSNQRLCGSRQFVVADVRAL